MGLLDRVLGESSTPTPELGTKEGIETNIWDVGDLVRWSPYDDGRDVYLKVNSLRNGTSWYCEIVHTYDDSFYKVGKVISLVLDLNMEVFKVNSYPGQVKALLYYDPSYDFEHVYYIKRGTVYIANSSGIGVVSGNYESPASLQRANALRRYEITPKWFNVNEAMED